MQPQKGGSFAPPLTSEALTKYVSLAASAPPQVSELMRKLILLAEEYKKHPTSTASGTQHSSGRGVVVPLAVAVVDALDPLVPWDEELRMFDVVFDKIDPVKDKALRNAAHHLLWYAKELSLGREPITIDRL